MQIKTQYLSHSMFYRVMAVKVNLNFEFFNLNDNDYHLHSCQLVSMITRNYCDVLSQVPPEPLRKGYCYWCYEQFKREACPECQAKIAGNLQ